MTDEQAVPSTAEELMLKISARFAPDKNGVVHGLATITLLEWRTVFYAYQAMASQLLPATENEDGQQLVTS